MGEQAEKFCVGSGGSIRLDARCFQVLRLFVPPLGLFRQVEVGDAAYEGQGIILYWRDVPAFTGSIFGEQCSFG